MGGRHPAAQVASGPQGRRDAGPRLLEAQRADSAGGPDQRRSRGGSGVDPRVLGVSHPGRADSASGCHRQCCHVLLELQCFSSGIFLNVCFVFSTNLKEKILTSLCWLYENLSLESVV